MKNLINIYTKKALEKHDDEIYNKGLREGNSKATVVWQQEFDNYRKDEKAKRFEIIKNIKDEVVELTVINNKKMLKDDKKVALDNKIIEILDLIKKYEEE